MAPIDLAPEIVQRIIFFLTFSPAPRFGDNPRELRRQRQDARRDALRYASVSRFWQVEIERKAFASLHLDLHRLSQLNSIVTPRRRAYVRKIQLHIKLPEPGPWHSREADDEKLRNNQAFQAVLEAFLQSLSQWDAAEVHKGGVELTLYVPLPPEELSAELREIGLPLGQWKHRYRKSVLELTDPGHITQLPPAVAITKLNMHWPSSDQERGLSVVAICALLTKLPAAKAVGLGWWKAPQFTRMRNDLADAVSQISHPIEVFELRDTTPNAVHNAQPLPDIFREENDRLSKSLHILSQRLQEFIIRDIPVSNEILFPQEIPMGMAEPRWDRLVYFCLHYSPIDPSGEFLFLPDSNIYESSSESESSVDSDIATVTTDASTLDLDIATPAVQRLYLAAARAALQMPALTEMELVAELGGDKYWHSFVYFIRGMSARAIWTSSSGFIPEDEVLELWHKVPRKYVQTELNVEISDDKYAI